MSILNKVKENIRKSNPINLGTNSSCNMCGEQFCSCAKRFKLIAFNLEDVLITLAKNGIKLQYWQDAAGITFNFGVWGSNGADSCSWQLGKDLDRQKPEVWEFILNLSK